MKKLLILLILTSITFSGFSFAEEGMYPVSDLKKLDLKKTGIKLTAKEIYNPGGVGLTDALVGVGGCSGAFISGDGLILTNHHCAFSAVQAASSTEHDYITDGFIATGREQEIEAKGLTVRITVGSRDVSKEILKAADGAVSPAERNKLIAKASADLVKAEEAANPGIKAEVSEMFAGKSYLLFKYQTIRDVRLVYVPPRSIGEFGGESDNWVWPRHTGDFSFVRAYVGKNGEPAAYSPENVPFHPKKVLKINPDGVKDGDFVFILGYPGRTFRHQPADFMAMQEEFDLPVISSLYDWQIRKMEEAGKNNPAVAIKLAARIKSLANVTKNFKGKIKGLTRLGLTQQRLNEENALQSWINENPGRKAKYGEVIPQIRQVYGEMKAEGNRNLWYRELYRTSGFLNFARILNDLKKYESVADSLRPTAYRKAGLIAIKSTSARTESNMHLPIEREFMKKVLLDAANLPAGQRVDAVDSRIGNSNPEMIVDSLVSVLFSEENRLTADMIAGLIDQTGDKKELSSNLWLQLAGDIEKQFAPIAERRNNWTGTLNKLMADYVDIKEQWKGAGFIPDANSTLRFTYGRVKGYQPFDGAWYSPVTSIAGVLEKATDEGDYFMEKRLQTIYTQTVKSGKKLPVAVLYNTDTTGGNSGSPVMNAKGELVAVNFDRSFEATVNDYNWSESYSRSMGVDIRYILWVTKEIGGAGYLLKEMGIN
ncbi:MAG: S46 family peptidase [Bacteroidetes bacterium]|nr:S46 family peptidase [Bacteroidota bacterium]